MNNFKFINTIIASNKDNNDKLKFLIYQNKNKKYITIYTCIDNIIYMNKLSEVSLSYTCYNVIMFNALFPTNNDNDKEYVWELLPTDSYFVVVLKNKHDWYHYTLYQTKNNYLENHKELFSIEDEPFILK